MRSYHFPRTRTIIRQGHVIGRGRRHSVHWWKRRGQLRTPALGYEENRTRSVRSVSPPYRCCGARGSIYHMHETFEHTADLGLRVRAPDLDTLFAEAAEALFAAIVEDLSAVQFQQQRDVQLTGDDHTYLLFDWLNELLYLFEIERLVFGRFKVQVTDKGLTGTAWGEPFDPARHQPGHEVKAITYHALRVEPAAEGWLAEVIVDI